jgi:hypothetical protein
MATLTLPNQLVEAIEKSCGPDLVAWMTEAVARHALETHCSGSTPGPKWNAADFIQEIVTLRLFDRDPDSIAAAEAEKV